MKKIVTTLFALLTFSISLMAQSDDTAFKPHGEFSGYIFGDYYYKAHADSLKRGDYQYSKIPKHKNAFQLRRVYLGYDYAISRKFTAKVLLEASGGKSGSNKLNFYIKYANLRWKDIFSHTDLIVGEMSTPTFSTFTEKIWGYRSIEKMNADMHHSGSYDLGVRLQGTFGAKGNFGYNLMAGNGTGALPENDKYKKFYSEVYGKLFNLHLIIDLYADYERIHWQPGFHHSRNMLKVFAAYTGKKFTAGASVFINRRQNDIALLPLNNSIAIDTTNEIALGISAFIHGTLIENKLGFFARYDHFNPYTKNVSDQYSYKGLSAGYDPNNTEQFITAGLDFTPVNNVHFMPNVWYQAFNSQNKSIRRNTSKSYDLVYRMTFYFIYK